MAKEYALVVNSADCVGCNACEVACKQEHSLPVGPRRIRVCHDSPREIEGKLQLRYTVTHCMHCSRPSCKDACPVDAISKRDNGIVLINEELCIGCKDCIDDAAYDANTSTLAAWAPDSDADVPDEWGVIPTNATEPWPEGFSLGVVVLLSSVAVAVGFYFLRKRPKTESGRVGKTGEITYTS